MAAGWGLFLDAEASAEERDRAWVALEERIRPPVLQELGRHLEGRRLVERLAAELCSELRDACDGLGGGEPRLRVRVAEEVQRVLHGRQAEGGVDREFDRDWASSLLRAALHALERSRLGAYRLLLRLYDGPEGRDPLGVEALAARLGLPAEGVIRELEEGRQALLRLFEGEIANTVADPGLVADERELLAPFVRELFGDAGQGNSQIEGLDAKARRKGRARKGG